MTPLEDKLQRARSALQDDPNIDLAETRATLNALYTAIMNCPSDAEVEAIWRTVRMGGPEIVRKTLGRILADRGS